MIRVLVADDDPLACKILKRLLGPDYQVDAYSNGEEALRHYQSHGADLLLTDLKMPRMGGLELLSAVKAIDPAALVFVITGHSSFESAVAAVKKGAYDYIAKPFDPDDVVLRISRALKERQLEETVSRYRMERMLKQGSPCPLTLNPRMLQMLDLAQRAARADSSILIQGETGVGKELVARSIHNWSPRREFPFIPVNCGAIAEGVLESELFGHEKGAFTGAVARRTGYFEMASKGTLFLDEIGTTGSNFQVKLLRVLQDHVISRVGGSTSVMVDSRIIAATNRQLEDDVRQGSFRSDLYYRLSVVTLQIPPLRERPEDIPMLANHFLKNFRSINPAVSAISADGMRLLQRYDFPGNVRELQNIIERAMILANGSELTQQNLLFGTTPEDTEREDEPLRMEEAEREHILRILESCAGRKQEAARILGINKTTLWRKMKRYGLQEE